jgi:hypothetical protein
MYNVTQLLPNGCKAALTIPVATPLAKAFLTPSGIFHLAVDDFK